MSVSSLLNVGGATLATLIIVYELYAPKVLGRDTMLSPIIHDVPEQVDSLAEEQSELREDVNNVENQLNNVQDQQGKLTDVTVAQSHMLNGYEGDMDVHRVEDRLLEDEESPRGYLEDDVEEHDDDE